ncbi:gonadotropin-releasing hormone receptor [Neocloeon triangulifer]|uniref:gonadotropin-releasing hormone receptor n=1 Tax=Neocloeon triangulifer TaxID=2078957 RepID=UPI00286EE791|nr:gonadotropin-releasing hormone receptor [Neocloeon triangulifer]XP_059486436.1 gonadotropin-releasing hormone receptor [Neocloeon triangulifer]
MMSEGNATFVEECERSNASESEDCLRHAPVLTHAAAVKSLVLAVMAVTSLVANVATIVSIHRHRKHRVSSVYRLILHLSIADLVVTFFCIGGDAIWHYTVEWYAGDMACKLFKFAQMLGLYLSTYVLVLIGVDRFVAVRYPMNCLTTKTCNRYVACAWALSAICSAPQFFIFRVVRGPFIEDFYQCVTHGFYTEKWQEQMYTMISFVLMFVLPLSVLVCTYFSTVFTIARSERLFKAEIESNGTTRFTAAPDLNRRRLMQRAKMKSLRISVVILAAFVIWWAPYYVSMIYFMFTASEELADDPEEQVLRSAIFFFGMSNSLVNPLIYGAFHLWRPRPRANSYRSAGFNRDGSTRRSTATHVSLRRCNSRSTRVTIGRGGMTSSPTSPAPIRELNGGASSGPEPTTETALVSLDCGASIEARLLEPDDEILGAAKLLGSDANDVILRKCAHQYPSDGQRNLRAYKC